MTAIDRRDLYLLFVIVAMGVVTAGYPSYVLHPITLLAPVPLLVALLTLDGARLTTPTWIVVVAAMMIWTALLYLAMDGTARGLVYSLSIYAPIAVLAFRLRRPEPVAIVFAVVTALLVSARMVVSWVRAGGQWVPWQVYEGNDLSARLNVVVPLVLVAMLSMRRRMRLERGALLVLVGIGLTSVVLAQERAGLGMLAVLIVIGLIRTNWRFLPAIVAAVGIAWIVLSDAISSVLERTRFVNFVPSNASRREIWRVAIEGLRGSSWLGVGPGNSGRALAEVGGGHAHNNLVQTALEAGWPGALFMSGFTIYLFVLAAQLLRRGGRDTLWAISLLAYMGFSAISSPIQRPDFTLALVLVVMVAREHVNPRGERCDP